MGKSAAARLQVTFGKRLEARRKRLGMSRDELAARTGIRANTIWRYERGLIAPGAARVALLARELGVSIDSLVVVEAA